MAGYLFNQLLNSTQVLKSNNGRILIANRNIYFIRNLSQKINDNKMLTLQTIIKSVHWLMQ